MGTIARGSKAGGGTNFNSGQTIDPAEVNTDFNTLFTEANGLLDDGNIETATIPGAKSLRFTEISAPSSPSSNDILLYAKDDGGTTKLFTKDSGGTETAISGALPRSFLSGLGLSTAADTDHDITIAVGEARDGSDTDDLLLASALTKQIDAAWAVGTNAGGLDTGAVGNTTWYHLWLIKRTDTGVVDVLFSTSATAPTMPTSYTLKRRLGSVLTNGSANILGFYQQGDYFGWDDPPLDVNDATEAATSRTLSVPTGFALMAHVNTHIDWTGANNYAYLSALAADDEAPAQAAAPLGDGTPDIQTHSVSARYFLTNTSAQIRTRTTGTLDSIKIVTIGWLDRRGRDD